MMQLFDAIRAGDLGAVTALVDGDASLVNLRNDQGIPVYAFALYNRKPEIAALLESRGAMLDIFTAAMAGKTALVEEMLAGNKSLVKLISADGWTALHLAAFFGHRDCAQALLNGGSEVNARSTNPMRNTPLHAGTAGRNAEVIKLLIDFGADVNARQHGGWTPLHAAAQSGDVEIAKLLLENGAEIGIRADNNQGAFDLALTRGHQAIVDLLEKHGASF
jgi:ankyrin repeat protein